MIAYIRAVEYRESLVDGPGLRSLVFFQGCDLRCPGCQNPSTWDITKGTPIEVEALADDIKAHAKNKKVTLTGGEPLLQKEAVLELLKLLEGYDVALYTGHDISEVPEEIRSRLAYLKYGPFVLKEKTSLKPYVGSKNQTFMKMGEKI